jgi:hypothetical protein
VQLSACHHAHTRVNLVNYARAVWAAERVPQLQRSRSAPLQHYWRSDVWLLNITPYVPRHKHQTTIPLSLPYLQLAEIIHTIRPLHPQMDLGPLQAHPPTSISVSTSRLLLVSVVASLVRWGKTCFRRLAANPSPRSSGIASPKGMS